MRRPLFAFVPLFGLILASSRSDYISIKQKFDAIEEARVKPGGRVAFTTSELNEYVRQELPEVAPPGVRDPRVELPGKNLATGRARINFLKLRNARGQPSGWLMRRLLDGERDVAVTTRIQSAAGQITVFVQRVEVSGVAIEGPALDFLIRNYLLPNYPNAKIGRPIQLKYGMDRVEVKPGEAHVVMAARR